MGHRAWAVHAGRRGMRGVASEAVLPASGQQAYAPELTPEDSLVDDQHPPAGDAPSELELVQIATSRPARRTDHDLIHARSAEGILRKRRDPSPLNVEHGKTDRPRRRKTELNC